jgi:O-antigen/teichoic acid export membrane protein
MAILSPEIVSILFGPGWSDVTVPLLILSFYGLFRAIVDFSTSLFGAVGKPRIFAELNLYILLLSLIPLYPFTIWWGIRGTAMSMTIPVVIVAVLAIRKGAEVLGGKTSDFYTRLRGPMIATEAMGVMLFALRVALIDLLPSRVPFPFLANGVSEVTIVLILGIACGIVVYFVVLRVVDGKTYGGLKRTLKIVFARRQAIDGE